MYSRWMGEIGITFRAILDRFRRIWCDINRIINDMVGTMVVNIFFY